MNGCLAADVIDRLASGADPTEGQRAHLGACAACTAALDAARIGAALFARLRRAGVSGSAALPTITGYALHEELHRGAQGVVFRATQQATGRMVAVKVLLGGAFATSRQRLRFEREIAALAGLDHPNVVAVHDAGTTDEGAAWFAMALAPGVPLDAWLAAPGHDLPARVAAIRDVAAGVAHAHRHGVLHRDLKPSNVIVDERGSARVVDFGLARPTASSVATREAGFVGTPAYAAPEQHAGDPARIDARSDVWALGVLLHEAVVGGPPFGGGDDLRAALRAAAEDPPAILRARGVDRGLRAIVLAALEKDPERRYQSAAAMLEDLERWRRGAPVVARDDVLRALIRDLLHRHRAALAAAALVVLLLLTFGVVSRLQYAQARREAEKVRRINVFLEDVLGSMEPDPGDGPPSVAALLEEATLWIDLVVGDDPEVEAALRGIVGNGFRALGDRDRAEPMLLETLRLRRAVLGAEHPDVADALARLGLLRRDAGRLDEAEALIAEALVIRRAALGEGHPSVAYGLSGLAEIARRAGDADRAASLYDEALAARRLGGAAEGHPDVAMIRYRQAELARARGNRAEAVRLHEMALAARRSALPEAHPDLTRSLEALGMTLLEAGRAGDAVPLLEEAAARRRAALGPDHGLTREAMRRRDRAIAEAARSGS